MLLVRNGILQCTLKAPHVPGPKELCVGLEGMEFEPEGFEIRLANGLDDHGMCFNAGTPSVPCVSTGIW